MAAIHMELDFPVAKGPLGPSDSTKGPRTTPKKAPKRPRICAQWPLTPENKKSDHILGYVAQNMI